MFPTLQGREELFPELPALWEAGPQPATRQAEPDTQGAPRGQRQAHTKHQHRLKVLTIFQTVPRLPRSP